MTIASLIVQVGADVGRLQTDVHKIQGQLDSVTSIAGKVGTALAGAFTVTAITGAIRSYSDFTGTLADMSAKTGIGVEALQRLKYAAEQNGGSLEQVSRAVTKLGVNLSGGNDSAVGALSALGLSFSAIRQMEPDKAFTTIADAIAKVPDPMAQAKLAMDLFGKSGAELLPMMKGNLSETAMEAQRLGLVMSSDAVAAGDKFGDTMHALTLVGQSVIAQVLTPMIPALTAVAGWLGDFIPKAISATRGAFDWLIQKGMELKVWLQSFILGVVELGSKVPWLGEKLGASAENVAALRSGLQQAKDALAIYSASTTAATAAQQKSIATVGQLNLNYAENEKNTKAAAKAAEDLQKAQERFAASVKNDFYTIDYYVQLKTAVKEASFELEELSSSTAIAANGMAPLKAAVQASGHAITGLGATLREGLMSTLTSIPQTLASAFQGGGNITGAIKSLVSQVGSAIGGSLGFMIGGPLGQKVGAALGSMTSMLVDPFKKLFGIGVNDSIKAANVEIEKLQQSLLGTYGSLEALERMANAVGLSFEANWAHQGEAGLKAFKALAADFESRVSGMTKKVSELKGELESALSHASSLGYNFNNAGELVSVSFEKMQEKAKLYGLDLASLGPQFQSARIHASATEIINDFNLLTLGGADVGGVLVGMKDEINALVLDSVKFGVEIPGNMQPWVEELLRTHQLTDENGVAMTELGALKFAAPIETEFQKISAKVGELIDAIALLVDKLNTSITPAIEAATRDRTIHIGYHLADPPVLPEFMGATVEWGGAQARGGDYFVTRPTLFLAGEAGPERATFSGAGRSDLPGDRGMVDEVRRLVRDLPRAMKVAVADAIVLQGAR